MEPTINRNEIITLILADMRSRKLIMGLEAAGLATDDFNTNLAGLIFTKMQIAKQYEVQVANWYDGTIYDLLNTDLHRFKTHELFLAIRLYDALEAKKNTLQEQKVITEDKPVFPFFKWVWGRRDN